MNDIKEQIDEYSRRGKYHELIVLLEQEIELARKIEDTFELKLKLAETYYLMREFSKARTLGEEMLQFVQEESNLILKGNIENLLGKIYRIHQRYDEALLHYENAKKYFSLSEYNPGLSKIYHNIGNVYVFLGQFKEALKNHHKSLELAKHEEMEEAIGSSYLNIGGIYYQNGQIDDALQYFNKARDIFEKIQDEPSLAAIYLNLAEVNLLRRDYKAARENSSKSSELYVRHQNLIGQKLALTALGKAEKSSGLFSDAINTFNTILEINSENIKEEILFELGESYAKTNQRIKAKEVFEKILNLPSLTPRGTGFSLDYLARIAIDMNDLEEAKAIYVRLLKFLTDMEPIDNDSIISTQANLGFVLLKKGEFDKAWEFLESCITYFRKMKNLEDLLTQTNNYRDFLISIKDYRNAIAVIEDFIIPNVEKLSKEKKRLDLHHYEVAFLHNLMGDSREALNYWIKKRKRNSFQKLSPSFLHSLIIDEDQREDLKKQHIKFLKLIHDLDKKGS